MSKIFPNLWFGRNAEEAADFYVGLGLSDSGIERVQRAGADYPGGGKAGDVVAIAFRLAGQRFVAINGGEAVPFSHAVSFEIECEDQAEVDRLWHAILAGGGKPIQCGWIADRYGLQWQIIPEALPRLLSDPDPKRARRAMEAMLGMVKIDVAELERAAAGE